MLSQGVPPLHVGHRQAAVFESPILGARVNHGRSGVAPGTEESCGVPSLETLQFFVGRMMQYSVRDDIFRILSKYTV